MAIHCIIVCEVSKYLYWLYVDVTDYHSFTLMHCPSYVSSTFNPSVSLNSRSRSLTLLYSTSSLSPISSARCGR